MTQLLGEKLQEIGVQWVQVPLPNPLTEDDLWAFPEAWARVSNESLGIPEGQEGPMIFASQEPHEGFSANACAMTFLLRGPVNLLTLMDGVHEQLPPGTEVLSFDTKKLKTTEQGVSTSLKTVYRADVEGNQVELIADSVYDLVDMGDQFLLLQRTVTARTDDPSAMPVFNEAIQG